MLAKVKVLARTKPFVEWVDSVMDLPGALEDNELVSRLNEEFYESGVQSFLISCSPRARQALPHPDGSDITSTSFSRYGAAGGRNGPRAHCRKGLDVATALAWPLG